MIVTFVDIEHFKRFNLYTNSEKVQILQKLGYNIVSQEDITYRKRFMKLSTLNSFVVIIGDEQYEVDQVFKDELTQRIFNLKI